MDIIDIPGLCDVWWEFFTYLYLVNYRNHNITYLTAWYKHGRVLCLFVAYWKLEYVFLWVQFVPVILMFLIKEKIPNTGRTRRKISQFYGPHLLLLSIHMHHRPLNNPVVQPWMLRWTTNSIHIKPGEVFDNACNTYLYALYIWH